ncbi:MAG TPA: hypothetical protein VJ577_05345 [Burkholderiaceae bacterium]|nr:hypothetical protein [Burkholderiaceae bacterium]
MSTRLFVALLAIAALSEAGAHPLELQGRPRSGLDGSYVWNLKLANGMTTRWETSVGKTGAVQDGESEWFRHGRSIGKRRVELEANKVGMMAIVQRSEAEDNAAYAIQNDTPELDALSDEFNALLDKISAECSSLPEEKQASCSGKYEQRVQALQNKMYAQKDAVARKSNSVSAVCTRLNLRLRDGTVSGTASNCGPEGDVPVTGTYRSVAAK